MAEIAQESPSSEQGPEPPRVIPKPVMLGLLLVGAVALIVFSGLHYLSGGGRLKVGDGYSAGPFVVGDQFNFVVPLRVDGNEIELRSAKVVSTGPGRVAVRLLRFDEGASQGGLSTGALEPGWHLVPLQGQHVHQRAPIGRAEYGLYLRITSGTTGATEIGQIDITYEAGRFRRRTVALHHPLCVWAVPNRASLGSFTFNGPPGPSNDPCTESPG